MDILNFASIELYDNIINETQLNLNFINIDGVNTTLLIHDEKYTNLKV